MKTLDIASELKPHVSYNSGNNEWYTPPEYIEAARRVMGAIDLDPASSDVANEVVKATTYYTASDNGLVQCWHGRVWLNPPYAAGLIDRFCGKLVAHVLRGDVTAACVLVNNATETQWFQGLLDVLACLCFVRKRVKFVAPGRKIGSPLQGQVIGYIGKDTETFEQEFTTFGSIWFASAPRRRLTTNPMLPGLDRFC